MIRVGAKDTTVPPYFARRMYRLIKEQGNNVTYSEIADKEHWWWDTYHTNDGGVVNDPEVRSFAIKNSKYSTRQVSNPGAVIILFALLNFLSFLPFSLSFLPSFLPSFPSFLPSFPSFLPSLPSFLHRLPSFLPYFPPFFLSFLPPFVHSILVPLIQIYASFALRYFLFYNTFFIIPVPSMLQKRKRRSFVPTGWYITI